jgi:hypothetical protein
MRPIKPYWREPVESYLDNISPEIQIIRREFLGFKRDADGTCFLKVHELYWCPHDDPTGDILFGEAPSTWFPRGLNFGESHLKFDFNTEPISGDPSEDNLNILDCGINYSRLLEWSDLRISEAEVEQFVSISYFDVDNQSFEPERKEMVDRFFSSECDANVLAIKERLRPFLQPQASRPEPSAW